MRSAPLYSLTFVLLTAFLSTIRAEEPINPYPRLILDEPLVRSWKFENDDAGWRSANNCELKPLDAGLAITVTGPDPYLYLPRVDLTFDEPLTLRFRMKANTGKMGQLYWITEENQQFGEHARAHFRMEPDGEWHDYQIPLDPQGTLRFIRLDPGMGVGQVELRDVELRRRRMHPLEITAVASSPHDVKVTIKNHQVDPIDFTLGGVRHSLAGDQSQQVLLPVPGSRPFQAVAISVQSGDLPPLQRTVHVYRPDATTDWVRLESEEVCIEIASDGSGARLFRQDKPVGVICPLVYRESGDIALDLIESSGSSALLRGTSGTEVRLTLSGDTLHFDATSATPIEGPVVRAIGRLEQGLLSGVEYLGRGEHSSSTADIESHEHIRFAPSVLDITMPLMALVTDRGSLALAWDDVRTQPIFATPNFFDGTSDHRMSLQGEAIQATLRIGPSFEEGGRLEQHILWDVTRRGLPNLPEVQRTAEEQRALSLSAVTGPIQGEGGWTHCLMGDGEPRTPRKYMADPASTIWRLSGTVPQTPSLEPGGAHLPDPSAYFLTDRADQWLTWYNSRASHICSRQRADGSFPYRGEYSKGHFEDTSSGWCGQAAFMLMEHAHDTGNQESLAAGLRALEQMKRFRTPRGAQVWELSLHTPDIMASAWVSSAYTRGYELTGREEYRELAVRWAITGLPFVYQWTTYDTMLYATIPVYGATNWQGPNWIGLPVQWCGLRYAHALMMLAPHDNTLDWRKIAEGILITGEHMQYPDGPAAGCLPDAFELPTQTRRPPDINPCALVHLRRQIEGKVAGLAWAGNERHRVLSPYKVEIVDGQARISATPGVRYQVILNGRRIETIDSQGLDVIDLELP